MSQCLKKNSLVWLQELIWYLKRTLVTTIELFQFQGIFTVDFTSESGTSAQQTPSGNLLRGIDNKTIK